MEYVLADWSCWSVFFNGVLIKTLGAGTV